MKDLPQRLPATDQPPAADAPGPWSSADWLCLTALAVLCLAIRLPAINAIWLGVDQHQYAATAAYLQADGVSAFSDPIGPVHTFELYRVLAWIFGPYSLASVRLFVLLIALGSSVLIFLIVRRAVGRGYGLLGGAVFLGYSVLFEGLSANREWFAGPLTLLGVFLYLQAIERRGKRALWLIAAAGLCCGVAAWFKLQAICTMAVVPAALAYRAIVDRRLRPAAIDMAAYTAGSAVAVGLFFLPFLLAGTADDYLVWFRQTSQSYVVESAGLPPEMAAARGLSPTSEAVPLQYFRAFYRHPFPMPLFLPYCLVLVWGVCVVMGGWRAIATKSRGVDTGTPLRSASATRRASLKDQLSDPTLVVFVFYLLAAMFAVQLGRRFFPHYFLLMMPPLAVLFSIALRWIVTLPRNKIAAVGVGGLIVLFLALEAANFWQSVSPWLWAAAFLLSGGSLAFLGLGHAVFCSRLARRCLLVTVGAQLGLMALCLPTVVRVLSERGVLCAGEKVPLENVVGYLRGQHHDGDRLFVWGWRPELYTFSRLQPASSFTITSYIIRDARVLRTGRVEPDPMLSDRLMRTLRDRPPRFIVDASRCSLALSHRWAYRLENLPPLAEFLASEYELTATLDDCDVYARKDSS